MIKANLDTKFMLLKLFSLCLGWLGFLLQLELPTSSALLKTLTQAGEFGLVAAAANVFLTLKLIDSGFNHKAAT